MPRPRSPASPAGSGRSSGRPATWARMFMWTWSSTPTGRSATTLFRRVLAEPEFRDWPDVGIVVQAYQPEAEAELRMLRDWVDCAGYADHDPAGQGGVLGLRGADRPAARLARAGLPAEVAKRCACTSACTRFLMEHHESFARPSAATTSAAWPTRSRRPRQLGVPPDGFELQTLHGMGDVIQDALVAGAGHRVRVYTPYGAMLPGMAYLVRRLLENTSNESFLKASFAERAAIDDLLRNPEEIGAMLSMNRTRRTSPMAAEAAGRCRRSATSR